MLNGIAALQISTLHNLAIALILAPLLRAHIDRSILRGLIGGSVLGIIAGFALQTAVSTTALKIAATVMVGFVTLLLLREMFSGQKNDAKQDVTRVEIVGVGTAAGLMGGMLAMPSPLAATWMSVREVQKSKSAPRRLPSSFSPMARIRYFTPDGMGWR